MTLSTRNTSRIKHDKELLIILFVIILKITSTYILVHSVYELHRDEFLHLDQSEHLAWGYLSVPPLTSWISVLIRLLGNSEFWVKFFPALFGALTIYAGWRIVSLLNGNLFAKTITAIALLLSVLLRINILYQPNSFDILSWTLVFLFLIKYLKTENTKWLYYLAVSFALGVLNKYSIVFLGISLSVSLALSAERKIFLLKHFWFAAILAFLLVLPNILWQVSNGFPVIRHMKELAETQLVNVSRTDFIKEQVLFFLNSIFLIIAGIIGFLKYEPFKKYRVVGLAYIICILLFTCFKAKGYYAIGLYPVLIAFGAVYLENISKGKAWIIRPVSFILIILLFVPMLIAFPLIRPSVINEKNELYKSLGLLKWEDGEDHHLPQDFADMLGWKEMAAKTDSILKTLPANDYTLIRTDNYGQAGAINYYAGLKAVSFSADYIDWFELDREIDHMILVKEISDNDPERKDEQVYFDTIYRAAVILDSNAREFGTNIYVLKNARKPIAALLKKEIEQIKTE